MDYYLLSSLLFYLLELPQDLNLEIKINSLCFPLNDCNFFWAISGFISRKLSVKCKMSWHVMIPVQQNPLIQWYLLDTMSNSSPHYIRINEDWNDRCCTYSCTGVALTEGKRLLSENCGSSALGGYLIILQAVSLVGWGFAVCFLLLE